MTGAAGSWECAVASGVEAPAKNGWPQEEQKAAPPLSIAPHFEQYIDLLSRSALPMCLRKRPEIVLT